MRGNPDQGPIFETCDNLANGGSPDHPRLMLAARITLPHFSVSSAMSLPHSADDSASAVAPRSVRRALMLGSARPALISPFSFSMIPIDVFLGTATPFQVLAS